MCLNYLIAFGTGLDAFSMAVAFGMCQNVCTRNT
jgi:putative Mn2+ efflux pump MntP